MFRLAQLFVEIGSDDTKLKKGLNDAHSMLAGMGTRLVGLAAGVGAGAFLYRAVQDASNLNETISKTGVVFGDATKDVIANANEMAEKFGDNKQELLDAASIFGLMAKGAGQSEAAAASFANQMVRLADDASSFYNVDLKTALEKIRSGLSGESEPLRQFGVFLTEDAVKAQGMAMGLELVNGQLTEGGKIMARQALILNGLADAQGDHSRTMSETQNQQKKILGDLHNATEAFGAAVLPIWNELLVAATSALSGITRWLGQSKESFDGWVGTIVGGLQTVVVIFRNWEIATQITELKFSESIINMGEWIQWFVDSSREYASWFGRNWFAIIRDTLMATLTIFENVFKNIRDLVKASWDFVMNPGAGWNFQGTELLKGFESTMEQLPDIARPHLTSLQDQIDALGEQMAKAEVDRMGRVAEAAGGAAKAVAQAAPGAAGQQGKASTMSLESFAQRLQEGAFGKNDVQQQQLAVQQRAAAAAERTARNTAQPRPAVAAP